MNESKTQWKWLYEIYDMDGNVSSRMIAEHDDEILHDIMNRFKEFMRGCGYEGDELDPPDNPWELLDDAMGLLHNHEQHADPEWQRDYEELCERFEEAT